MKTPTGWTLQPNLLLIEPWDEEGESPGGIWLDHNWEAQAGHAFGLVLQKADHCDTPDLSAMMREVNVGDLVLFTRGAHIKSRSYEGEPLLFVNIEDIQSVLVMEEQDIERYGATFLDS